METVLAAAALAAGVAAIVWGAETFAEHLAGAAARLGVSAFALAVLLAGAEPEELATTVTASLRGLPAIAFGDVVGANVAMCTVALGVAALLAPVPFGPRVRRYGLFALPTGAVMAAVAWDGRVGRAEGVLLVGLYVAYVAAIWLAERAPPALGEVGELAEARDGGSRVGRDQAPQTTPQLRLGRRGARVAQPHGAAQPQRSGRRAATQPVVADAECCR